VKFSPQLDVSMPQGRWRARLGFDLAQVSAIAGSVDRFGDRFTRRFFTAGERDYAQSAAAARVRSERLAARFAAKEAVIKALSLAEAGIDWRDIEVVRQRGGECGLQLHGRVAEIAQRMGVHKVLLSLSHDGDYAGAVVSVLAAASDEDEDEITKPETTKASDS
jgi:holo-[acyl-carrier protein] synthase